MLLKPRRKLFGKYNNRKLLMWSSNWFAGNLGEVVIVPKKSNQSSRLRFTWPGLESELFETLDCIAEPNGNLCIWYWRFHLEFILLVFEFPFSMNKKTYLFNPNISSDSRDIHDPMRGCCHQIENLIFAIYTSLA